MSEIDARWKMSDVREALDALESLLDRRQRIAIRLFSSAQRYLTQLRNILESGGVVEHYGRLRRYYRRIRTVTSLLRAERRARRQKRGAA